MATQQLVMSDAPKIDMRKLPALSKLRSKEISLPEKYLEARDALRKCWRIDEVKEIQDKHSAIAHYAKQVKDNSLLFYAERIKLRALERLGELLMEIPDEEGRRAAYRANGIASVTFGRAKRMLDIPKRVRDTLIEQTPPAKAHHFSSAADSINGVYRRTRFWDHAREDDRINKTPKYWSDMLGAALECGDDVSMLKFRHAFLDRDYLWLDRIVAGGDADWIRRAMTPWAEFLDRLDVIVSRHEEK